MAERIGHQREHVPSLGCYRLLQSRAVGYSPCCRGPDIFDDEIHRWIGVQCRS